MSTKAAYSADVESVVAKLGPIGVWLGTPLGGAPAATVRSLTADIERLGYSALWIGEAPGFREVFTHAGLLLSASRNLIIAAGIANIRIRDPLAMTAAAQTLSEAYPGRFVLGLGTSHPSLLGLENQKEKPLDLMRNYLDALDQVAMGSEVLQTPTPRVLAALRPAMQRLGQERARGVHTFSVPPVHTAATRQRLGPGALIVPEQAVVLDESPSTARAKARAHVRTRLAMPNYVGSFRAIGFNDDDLAGEGSDRLVDSIVAWGSPQRVAERVREHLDAGADHVAVHPVSNDAHVITRELATLAPLLMPRAGDNTDTAVDGPHAIQERSR